MLRRDLFLNFHIVRKHNTTHRNNGMKMQNKIWADCQQTSDNEISQTTAQPPKETIWHWQRDWHGLWQGNIRHS